MFIRVFYLQLKIAIFAFWGRQIIFKKINMTQTFQYVRVAEFNFQE